MTHAVATHSGQSGQPGEQRDRAAEEAVEERLRRNDSPSQAAIATVVIQ